VYTISMFGVVIPRTHLIAVIRTIGCALHITDDHFTHHLEYKSPSYR